MNILTIFTMLQETVTDLALQAEVAIQEGAGELLPDAEGAAEAANAAAQAPEKTGSPWMMWGMIALIFVLMWIFMIRPQRKQQKELQKFRDELKKGQKIVTVGGIYGTIDQVQEKTLLVRVDRDVLIRVDKNCVVKDYSEAEASIKQ